MKILQNFVAFSEYINFSMKTWTEHGQKKFYACSFRGNSLNNLLSYCGLIDAKVRGSDKDGSVMIKRASLIFFWLYCIVYVSLYLNFHKSLPPPVLHEL